MMDQRSAIDALPNLPGLGDPDPSGRSYLPPGPTEWHFPGSNFLGPGTDLVARAGIVPSSEVDAAARDHDIAYAEIERLYREGLISKDEARHDIRRADEEFRRRVRVTGTILGYMSDLGIAAKERLEDLGVLSPSRFTSLKRKRADVYDYPPNVGGFPEPEASQAAVKRRKNPRGSKRKVGDALNPFPSQGDARFRGPGGSFSIGSRRVYAGPMFPYFNRRPGLRASKARLDAEKRLWNRRATGFSKSVITDDDMYMVGVSVPDYVRRDRSNVGVGVRVGGAVGRRVFRRKRLPSIPAAFLHARTPCAEKRFRSRKWKYGFRMKRRFVCKRRKC